MWIKKIEELWTEFQWGNVDWTENVSRAKMALLIDKILDPFNKNKLMFMVIILDRKLEEISE